MSVSTMQFLPKPYELFYYLTVLKPRKMARKTLFNNSLQTVCFKENWQHLMLFRCSCVEGYTGPNCDEPINYCRNVSCLNGGTCITEEKTYSCSCSAPYYGSHCEFKRNSKYILNFSRYDTSDYIKLPGIEKNLTEVSLLHLQLLLCFEDLSIVFPLFHKLISNFLAHFFNNSHYCFVRFSVVLKSV